MVEWDAIPDIPEFELPSESAVELDEEKYRRFVHWSWRMDLDVGLFDNYYDDDDEDAIRRDDERSIVATEDDGDDVVATVEDEEEVKTMVSRNPTVRMV